MAYISNNLRIAIRSAIKDDQQRLMTLMHFEQYVHRHLDWVSPIDMIDTKPFMVIEQEGILQAALSCPVDPPGIAWIRLFVSSGSVSHEAMWQLLWSEVKHHVRQSNANKVVAIALHKWMSDLLERSKFKHTQNVVFLTWNSPSRFNLTTQRYTIIRKMNQADLPSVAKVDADAFSPVWRNSLSSLNAAFDQSYISTVAEDKEGIYGYQISTAGHMGGHLARLAVHPNRQGEKRGYDLLVDALRKFHEFKVHKVSVNTQQDNLVSLNLYQKVGFKMTGETYGVYEYLFD